MTGHAHVARPKNPPHQRRRLSVIFSFSFFHLCWFTLSRLATIIYPFCQPKKEESNITRCVTSTSLYSSIWRGGIINVQQTHWIIHEMFFTYWEGRDVFFFFFFYGVMFEMGEYPSSKTIRVRAWPCVHMCWKWARLFWILFPASLFFQGWKDVKNLGTFDSKYAAAYKCA